MEGLFQNVFERRTRPHVAHSNRFHPSTGKGQQQQQQQQQSLLGS